LLEYLERSPERSLIFKGGTALAKIFFDFNRLSEDLDFIISMPFNASRSDRSDRITPYKKLISDLPDTEPFFHVKEPLRGRNESRQYIASIEYTSLYDGHKDTIELEIGLREPVLADSIKGMATTLLQNAVNPATIIAPIPVQCLSFEEAMAEKFRAALSRRDVAIRDFYDVDYAVRKKNFIVVDRNFIEMIRKKLSVPGNDRPDVSEERLSMLRDQLNARLKPVLRPKDFAAFELDRAIGHVLDVNSLL
jgi:predicted nucleotidyltransferase component of viral defense system